MALTLTAATAFSTAPPAAVSSAAQRTAQHTAAPATPVVAQGAARSSFQAAAARQVVPAQKKGVVATAAQKSPPTTLGVSAGTPFVLGYYLPGSGSATSLAANYADISAIAPLWFGIHADGSVQHRSGGNLASIVQEAHNLGRKVYVLVTNMAQDRILVNASLRQTAVHNLVATVLQNHLDGVNIDFESIDGTDAQGLVDFVSAVHAALAPHGVLTTVAVGPRTSSQLPVGDQSDAYDYAALGRVSDYVVLMTYDEHCPPGGAGPIAALPWVRNVVNYALTQMPAQKILLGIAAYGYDWSQPGTPTVTARAAIAQINAGGVQVGWSSTAAEPYYTSGAHDVWFEDSYSAAPKFRLVKADHLGGIALWYLGAEDSLFWQTVRSDLLN